MALAKKDPPRDIDLVDDMLSEIKGRYADLGRAMPGIDFTDVHRLVLALESVLSELTTDEFDGLVADALLGRA